MLEINLKSMEGAIRRNPSAVPRKGGDIRATNGVRENTRKQEILGSVRTEGGVVAIGKNLEEKKGEAKTTRCSLFGVNLEKKNSEGRSAIGSEREKGFSSEEIKGGGGEGSKN